MWVGGREGLGGVHRGGESSMDVSADLTELGRTPVTVICAGVKTVLDIPRTLEYLETQVSVQIFPLAWHLCVVSLHASWLCGALPCQLFACILALWCSTLSQLVTDLRGQHTLGCCLSHSSKSPESAPTVQRHKTGCDFSGRGFE